MNGGLERHGRGRRSEEGRRGCVGDWDRAGLLPALEVQCGLTVRMGLPAPHPQVVSEGHAGWGLLSGAADGSLATWRPRGDLLQLLQLPASSPVVLAGSGHGVVATGEGRGGEGGGGPMRPFGRARVGAAVRNKPYHSSLYRSNGDQPAQHMAINADSTHT